MANTIHYGYRLRSSEINARGVGKTQAIFDDNGYAEVDPTDANLVGAINEQGGADIDKEGSEEVLTAGTVQTATTLSALVFRNGVGTTVLNVRALDGAGAIVLGPLTIAADAERVIVLPAQITGITGGVFIDVDSGALHATPGFLIP